MPNALILVAHIFFLFKKIVKLYASHLKISKLSKWYIFLQNLVITNSNSIATLALRAKSCISADNALNRTQTSSVTLHQFSAGDIKKMWLTTILSPEDITFGHL